MCFMSSAELSREIINAVGGGDEVAVRAWLERGGGKTNGAFKLWSEIGCFVSKTTLLMYAAEHGHERVVDLLLQHGAETNLQASNGNTALMLAVLHGHERVVELLLKRGAETNKRDGIGRTALTIAAHHNNNPAIIIRLLRAGADSKMRERVTGATALQLAKGFGHAECMRALEEHAAAKTAAEGRGLMEALDQLLDRRAEAKLARRAEAEAEAARHADAMLVEAQAQAEAQAEESQKKKKRTRRRRRKGEVGESGTAGPLSHEANAPAEAAEDEAAAEEELAAALEVSARLEGERRATEQACKPGEPEPAEPPDDFFCPITTEVMSEPVMAADGQSYERSAIERWLATKSTSPLTGEALENTGLFPNYSLRRMIRQWQEGQKDRA